MIARCPAPPIPSCPIPLGTRRGRRGGRLTRGAPASGAPAPRDTSLSASPRDEAGPAGWVLIAALDCERLAAPPARINLGDVAGIDTGRGAERSFLRTGDRMRIELPDRWASQVH